MKKVFNVFNVFSVCVALCVAHIAYGQNGINSPYSRYGFGILSDRSMSFNKGMSGVAQGFRGGQIINPANPASYSEVDSLTALFDLGATFQNGNFSMDGIKCNAKNTSIDYFAFHFRAGKNVGVAVGMLPYSNVKYSFETQAQAVEGTSETTQSTTYVGDGGLRQVFLGAGWRFLRNASIGANIAYLYGDYSHTSTLSFSNSSVSSLYQNYTAGIYSYTLDLGAQYWFNLGKKDRLSVGFTYGLGHDMNNDAKRITNKIQGTTVTSDTICTENAFQFPHTFALGFAYSHTYKWQAGLDFELQKWSKCRFPYGSLNDRMKISLGGAYRPAASGKLFERMQYKAGAYFSQSYANADLTGTLSDKPYEFGLSAGFGIPLSTRHLLSRNNVPVLNITAQWIYTNIPYLSNVASTKQTLVENYLKLSIGLTFSERWFNKWKVQ